MVMKQWNRRGLLGAGLALPALWLAGDGRGQDEGGQDQGRVHQSRPIRCADLLETLGVNTHLRFADSQYRDVEAVQAALAWCGIRHVRDTAIARQAPGADRYYQLAAAGIRFCLFWGTGRPMDDAISQISALEAAHPGAVEFLEGPNEIQPRFAYAGLTGTAAGARFMADMKAATDPLLRAKPLVSFTSYRPVASVADFGNHHPYPKAGVQPGELIRLRRDQWVGKAGAMPGKPMMFTEFGYHTLVGSPAHPGHWQGVDEETQAVLLLNGLLDAAAVGVTRTYVYQLFDGRADRPDHVTQENHFGLFRYDGRPKPAATALRNLGALIADNAMHAHTFPVTPLSVHVEAERPVSVLPIQNAAGRHSLVLWQEALVWDQQTMAPIRPSPLAVTLEGLREEAVSAVSIVDNRPLPIRTEGRSSRLALGASAVLVRLG